VDADERQQLRLEVDRAGPGGAASRRPLLRRVRRPAREYQRLAPLFSPHDLRHRRISLLHLRGMPWARRPYKMAT
jgi:hypothetical protein